MTSARDQFRRVGRKAGWAPSLLAALLVANVAAQSSFADPHYWPSIIAAFAPLALAAMASTPAILTRGVDLSVSPQVIFVNILIVKVLLPTGATSGVLLIPMILMIGAAVGALLGLAIGYGRLPSILVTLCGLFVLTGVDSALLPNPLSAGSSWVDHLAGSIGPIPGGIFMIGGPLLLWLAIDRTALRVTIRAVGSSDAASISAGVNVNAVRVVAYGLGGLLAACGGLAYTALVRSADATTAQQYTIVALAAVGLGGTSLAGGQGGLGKSLVGAGCLFLLQQLLYSASVSVSWLEFLYGVALLVVVTLSGRRSAGVLA